MRQRKGAKTQQAAYRVFVSHASPDSWVAGQIAKEVQACGASVFIDTEAIRGGDQFRKKILMEIEFCHEMVVLFTPWSINRLWVQQEVGGVTALGKRVTPVFYQVSLADFETYGGMGMLSDRKHVMINELDRYFSDLKKRVAGRP